MKSTSTTYRLINEKTAPEIPIIRALWKRHKMGRLRPLGFPTIVAERNRRIIGFISTHPSQDTISAGPLVVDVEGLKAPVAMRLIDFYERVLVAAGVTRYFFRVMRDSPKSYLKTIEDFGLKPYSQDDTGLNYARELRGQKDEQPQTS